MIKVHHLVLGMEGWKYSWVSGALFVIMISIILMPKWLVCRWDMMMAKL